jgi:hypothetical protein
MAISASELRQNVYKLLDQVLETGVPLEIERKGHLLRLEPAEPVNKLDRLTPHPGYWIGDPDDIFHMDWLKDWDPGTD